jgi:hypothetical protein
MKTCVLFLAALGATAILLGACGDDDEGTASPAATAPSSASPTVAHTPPPTQTLSPGQTPATPNVCRPNPDPAPPSIQVIDSPAPGSSVTSPVTITGAIAAFEATFKITIFQADGSIIADVTGMSAQGQTLAPFSATVPFTVGARKPACLWVYERSARDGLPIHVVQVPLTLVP